MQIEISFGIEAAIVLSKYLAVPVVIFRFEPHIAAASSMPELNNFTAISAAEAKTNAKTQLIVSQYFFMIFRHLCRLKIRHFFLLV